MRQIPQEFLWMIKQDIIHINDVINQSSDDDKILQLHREIDGKYQACIINWGQSMWGYNNKLGFIYSMLEKGSLLENLQLMKSKLETFCYQANAVPNMMPPVSNLTVNIDNNINLNITFEMVRTQIKNMTSLTESQTSETLDKVDEIEQIVHSTENKKTKWEKIKPILIWLTDKSFDVGIQLLPLLLKI